MTDISTSALGYTCPLLTDIDLSYCKKITDTGLLALLFSCHLLTKISLIECGGVTDIGNATALGRLIYKISSWSMLSFTNGHMSLGLLLHH